MLDRQSPTTKTEFPEKLTSAQAISRNKVGVHKPRAALGLQSTSTGVNNKQITEKLSFLKTRLSIHTKATKLATDLPPLTLAVVLLVQTLVVRDAVLAEHEPIHDQAALAKKPPQANRDDSKIDRLRWPKATVESAFIQNVTRMNSARALRSSLGAGGIGLEETHPAMRGIVRATMIAEFWRSTKNSQKESNGRKEERRETDGVEASPGRKSISCFFRPSANSA